MFLFIIFLKKLARLSANFYTDTVAKMAGEVKFKKRKTPHRLAFSNDTFIVASPFLMSTKFTYFHVVARVRSRDIILL